MIGTLVKVLRMIPGVKTPEAPAPESEPVTEGDRERQRETEEAERSVELLRARVAGVKATAGRDDF